MEDKARQNAVHSCSKILKDYTQLTGSFFIIKYYILHAFTQLPLHLKKNPDFKHHHKLMFLTNFDVNLTTSPGGVMNPVFNSLCTPAPRDEVRLTSKGRFREVKFSGSFSSLISRPLNRSLPNSASILSN